MKKKEPIGIKILKAVVVIGCVIGGICIGFYKVPNQDITLKIDTDKGKITVECSADEIRSLLKTNSKGEVLEPSAESGDTSLYINWRDIGASELKEIKVYRLFDTIAVGKINSGTIWQYGSFDQNGIVFNQAGVKFLYDISTTYLLERMIFAEILITVAVFLWILINALKEKMDPDNRDNHGPIYEIKAFFKNIGKYKQYMLFAAQADLQAEVANSYLNRLWWVLEPFCNMLVYVVVFGQVMGNSIERYATFVFSALLMWNYFNHIINYSVKCVRFNRDIVTKIYVPKYVLLLTNMVLNFIKLLFSIAVLVIMLFIFRTPISITMLWVIPSYILMFILAFGVGMLFVHYGVFIDDLAYAVGILLTLLMFLSGIFYDVITTLPNPLNNILMCINPVAVFVDSMRNGLLYQEITNVPLMVIWTILGLLISYIGIHTVNKNENGYVKVI